MPTSPLDAARKASKQLEKHATALADAFTALPPDSDRAPFAALAALADLESAWKGLHAARDLVAEHEPRWSAQRVEAEGIAERHRAAFAGALADALEAAPWPLKGRLPALELGPLTLELVGTLKPELKVHFGPRIELLETLPVDPAKVAEAVLRLANELNRPLDSDALLRELQAAWRAARARSGDAAHPSIAAVMGELALGRQAPAFWASPTRQNFQPLSRVQLAFDLSRLSRRTVDGATLVLGVATRDQTKRLADHLWVPNGASLSGTHFASLGFERLDT